MSQLGLGLGLSNVSSLLRFSPLDLDPYLLFDTQSSMIGTFENPTLDLDPSVPSTLDVITATRAGVATYTDADGLIQSASADTVRVDYTQGAELTPTKYQHIGYTDFSSGRVLSNFGTGVTPVLSSDALGSPNGTEDAYKIVFNSGSGTTSGNGSELYFNASEIEDNIQSTASIYLRGENGGEQLIFRGASNGSYQLVTLTTEWQRFTTTESTSPSGNQKFTFGIRQSVSGHGVINSAATIYAYGPQLEEGTTASDFVANTTGSPKFITGATYGPRVPMILVEPSSENLWGWSEGTLNDYVTNAVLTEETYFSDDATSRNGLGNWLNVAPSSNTTVGFRLPVSVASGSTMILSFYVIMDDGSKPRVGTSSTGSDTDFAILLQGSSSAGAYGGVEHIDGDLYRVWAYRVFTGTSNGQYIYRYATHSGKGFKISGVMLEESSVPTSYIPTLSGSPVTRAADDLSIRDRTNLVPYSEDFSQSAWSKNNVTLSSGFSAPDGSMNASKLEANAADSSLQYTFTVTSGTTYSVSFYLKTISGSLETAIGLGSPGFPQNEGEGGRYKNITVTDEWQRFTLTSTADASAATGISFGGFSSFSTGEEVYIWGAQFEEGSESTSLIPTSGAAASRTTFSDFFNTGGDGTFYAEFDALNKSDTFYLLGGSTGSNRLFYSNAGTQFYSYDGAQSLVFGHVQTGLNRAAISYNSTEQDGSMNGGVGAIANTTHNGNFSGLTELRIGYDHNGDYHLNGHIKRVLFWPTHSSRL